MIASARQISLFPEAMPVPAPNPDDEVFWSWCAQQQLRFQACSACAQLRHPPIVICPACQSDEVEWRLAPSHGEIFSYTFVHHSMHEATSDMVPYAVVLVTFPGLDGVRLASNLIEAEPGSITIGQPVELLWQPAGDLFLPRFRTLSE